MNLPFPLCREPRHEERIREALERCVAFLVERLPPSHLVAVMLTGSFARGEGSVLPRGGVLRVLGDFEFFVVLPSGHDARAERRQFAVWGREAAGRLAAAGIQAEVEFGPVEVDFFRLRARPSIFVSDLRRHGKVLWGRKDLLAEIPEFGVEQIPPDDALSLLFNRTIEQLEAHERLARASGDALLDIVYQRLKLTLDLAGSALAFAGVHTALYQRRPAAFARLLAETPSLGQHVPSWFADELARSAAAKLEPAEHVVWPPDGTGVEEQRELLRGAILSAAPAVAAFLRWELEQAVGASGELPALLDAYTRTPPLRRRLREWARVVLHPMPAPLPITHGMIASLVWRSTPRALLYAAGARAYLELAELVTNGDDFMRLLPVARAARPRHAAARRAAVVALWKWCIRNN
ncbi:MAG: hypothetical protein AUH30_10770 [Candidatus Rokubacteria bacterium 13_1_40CM_68_15]|nr:MAG: hypothetical protein AUH30_10770 [Candidatus Rokubacteria bacterium 13_1_40CM_68_15]